MRIAIVALVAGVTLAPSFVEAQRPPARTQARSQAATRHEFGVDVGLAWVSPEGPADSRFRIGSPVDIRVGFGSRGRLMWEPRFGIAYDSEGFSGSATYAFTPQLVALYSMTPQRHRRGMYLFGGAGVNFMDVTGGNAGTTFTVGGGVGTRKRYGDAAIRLEAGLRYDTEDASALMPAQFSIGTRVGLSFWH
jgi:hypothetical protein